MKNLLKVENYAEEYFRNAYKCDHKERFIVQFPIKENKYWDCLEKMQLADYIVYGSD